MKTAYNPGFREEIEADRDYAKGINDICREIRAEARRLAPGRQLRDVAVGPHSVHLMGHFDHIIEFGSVNNHPYMPLRRAIIGLGYELREIPKPFSQTIGVG